MNAITILPATPPEMYPITQELSTVKLAGKTIAEHLFARLGSSSEAREITAFADFFPSDAITRQVAESNVNLSVLDPADGTVLITLTVHGCSEKAEIFADKSSVRLRFAWDLLRLNEMLVGTIHAHEIHGTVREGAVIDGNIILGENSVILPGVYIEGNAVIGKNCKVGPNCYIRGNTTIGDNCRIGQAVEVKNSIIMDNVAAAHLAYVGDSVVCSHVNLGAGTVVSNLRHDNNNHRYRIGHMILETDRRKFGAVIGENVSTGIHTAIYPGRSLAPGVVTEPGEIVRD